MTDNHIEALSTMGAIAALCAVRAEQTSSDEERLACHAINHLVKLAMVPLMKGLRAEDIAKALERAKEITDEWKQDAIAFGGSN